MIMFTLPLPLKMRVVGEQNEQIESCNNMGERSTAFANILHQVLGGQILELRLVNKFFFLIDVEFLT